MKSQQLPEEQLELPGARNATPWSCKRVAWASKGASRLRSVVEAAGELLAMKPAPGGAKEVDHVAVAVPPVAQEAPAAPEAFVPPPRARATVKIQAEAEVVELPVEKSEGSKVRSHSEPPEAAASLEKAPMALKHLLDARSVAAIAEAFRYLLRCVELHEEETGKTQGKEAGAGSD